MDLDKMRWALKRVNIKVMCEEIGIAPQTVYRLRDNANEGPTLKTALKISAYLKKMSEGCIHE